MNHIKVIALFFLILTTSSGQEDGFNPKDYGFQISHLSIPFSLPYGYEPVLTVKLDKNLKPDKKYEIGFWVTAQKNEKYSRYAYDLWVFPANFMERTVDEDRELSESHDIFPTVLIDRIQHYEKEYLKFTVSPDTTYTHLTFGVKKSEPVAFRMRDYVKIDGVFVWPLSEASTEPETKSTRQESGLAVSQKITTERKLIDKGEAFTVNDAKIEIALYDHRRIDGDIVTIYLNDEIIVSKLPLKRKKKKYRAKLKPGANTITLYAENLGEVPPNTAAIEILGGKQKIEQVLTSDLDQSEFFTIYYEPDGKK